MHVHAMAHAFASMQVHTTCRAAELQNRRTAELHRHMHMSRLGREWGTCMHILRLGHYLCTCMQTPLKNDFEMGKTDSFTLGAKDVGNITKIKVSGPPGVVVVPLPVLNVNACMRWQGTGGGCVQA